MTICAIHQPNFFPWLGYFNKIQQADTFIFLDNVAYPKSGSGSGSWCNRVQLAIQGSAQWVGCPIRRESGVQLIKDVKIDDKQPWRKKMLRTLEFNYKKARNYQEVIPSLTKLIEYETDCLAAFNVHAIQHISDMLGLKVKFQLQSELPVSGMSTELLINIVKAVNATTYLCGGGAGSYQDDALFLEHSLKLNYQNFKPEAYGCEPEKFIPGLSVIDFLMKKETCDA